MPWKKGVAIAGHICEDIVKLIPSYPKQGVLANITGIQHSVGGAVSNTSINLATIGGVRVSAIGLLGKDDTGRFIREKLSSHGVDVSLLRQDDRVNSSFTDVMQAADTGERTFFHYTGTNAHFGPEHIDLDALDCDLLHLAYISLLDRFDAADPDYGTVMGRFLHDVQQRGILTSVDTVSSPREDYAHLVESAFRYCDYAFTNEVEGSMVSGLPCRDGNGRLIVDNVIKTMERCMSFGVRRRLILHCPEAGFCMDAEKGLSIVPSLKLPKGFIKGSVGAGDCFCAGCLHEMAQDADTEEMLSFAAAAAAANLSQADSISGMLPEAGIRELMERYPRLEMP